jgi:hypothetical protein
MPHSPPRRLALAALALAALAALPSCGGRRSQRRFMDSNMDFGSVKTVAVLPFANLSRDALAGERVRDVFANMLLAAGAFYVMPNGEVYRAAGQAGVGSITAPTVEDVTKLGKLLKADAIFTGVVKEYGEVRSGAASGNAVSLSVQLQETLTGRIVWSASSTKGGISFSGRLLGGGGAPINDVTEEAVDDLLDQLFK